MRPVGTAHLSIARSVSLLVLAVALGLTCPSAAAQESSTPSPSPSPAEAATPTALERTPAPTSGPDSEGRYPPPDFAFVVFLPEFGVATPPPEAAPAPSPNEVSSDIETPTPDGDALTPPPGVSIPGRGPDDAELVAGLTDMAAAGGQVDPQLASIAAWLTKGLADGLHSHERYHVVQPAHMPRISTLSAAEIWAGCTDELGCMSLLGDRARARVSLSGEISTPDGGELPVRVRLYDLDWGEEIEGLNLRLPWPDTPSKGDATPTETPGETAEAKAPRSPWPGEALEALMVAVDARLLPLTLTEVDAVAPQEDGAGPSLAEEQAALDAKLVAGLDALAAQPDEEEAAVAARYEGRGVEGLELDEDEREMLGMSPEQYLRFKKGGWTEAEWRERSRGRMGHVAIRVGGGPLAGEMAQIYDGVILMGDVTTEVVEKYAHLTPTLGAGWVAQGGVAVGIAPDIEVEGRVGFSRSESTARTLQSFAERYPCEASPACPKIENIPTRLLLLEGVARYYIRRAWVFRPYLSVGGQAMRFQDIPDAYSTFSSTPFPTAYDAFPPLWTLGLTGAVGFTYEVGPGAHFYAEIPLYVRMVSTAYDPLHYYASQPLVEEPDRPFSAPLMISARVGLHVRIFQGR